MVEDNVLVKLPSDISQIFEANVANVGLSYKAIVPDIDVKHPFERTIDTH